MKLISEPSPAPSAFDLNFDELRLKYVDKKPDLVLFSSMYHGGLMQQYWHIPAGRILSARFTPCPPQSSARPEKTSLKLRIILTLSTHTVNLDCKVVHLDYNWGKIAAAKEKIRPRFHHERPGFPRFRAYQQWNLKMLRSDEIIEEFEIEVLDDYMERALEHRHTSGNMEKIVHVKYLFRNFRFSALFKAKWL